MFNVLQSFIKLFFNINAGGLLVSVCFKACSHQEG